MAAQKNSEIEVVQFTSASQDNSDTVVTGLPGDCRGWLVAEMVRTAFLSSSLAGQSPALPALQSLVPHLSPRQTGFRDFLGKPGDMSPGGHGGAPWAFP